MLRYMSNSKTTLGNCNCVWIMAVGGLSYTVQDVACIGIFINMISTYHGRELVHRHLDVPLTYHVVHTYVINFMRTKFKNCGRSAERKYEILMRRKFQRLRYCCFRLCCEEVWVVKKYGQGCFNERMLRQKMYQKCHDAEKLNTELF